MANKYDHDVIVIGAGVGGLVCGCYLARAGLKTLIIEKNLKVGGYCTSFATKGFSFDACVHSLGSCRAEGRITEILRELKLDTTLNIKRFDPSDTIISPHYKICFYSDLAKTIHDFQKSFPEEATKINEFFNYVSTVKGIFLARLRDKTFHDLLNLYFKNQKLKSIIALPILGNAGLPPSLMSALMAITVYKEFMIDGGYYPRGGMQEFPDGLAANFRKFNGKLMLSKCVKKIKVNNKTTEGVFLEDGTFLSSKYVVSGCDAMQTFLNLIGKEYLAETVKNKLNSMTPSLSMLVLYLGIDETFNALPASGCNVWFMSHYDIEKMYLDAKKRTENNLSWFMVRLAPSSKSITAFVNASFESDAYWRERKKRLIEALIKKIEQVIPELSKHIIFKDAATPATLYRYTLNYRGAAYGWESLPSQLAISEFCQSTPIKNLYISSHWSTVFGYGIQGVSYLGLNAAKMILKRERDRK